jgi:hypothetical protein
MNPNDKLVILWGLVHIISLPIALRVQGYALAQQHPALTALLILGGMAANLLFLTWVGSVWVTSGWIVASGGITLYLWRWLR